jgi:hypothetical protein
LTAKILDQRCLHEQMQPDASRARADVGKRKRRIAMMNQEDKTTVEFSFKNDSEEISRLHVHRF